MQIRHRLAAIGCLTIMVALVIGSLAYYNIRELKGSLEVYRSSSEQIQRLGRLDAFIEGVAAPYNSAIVYLMMGEDPGGVLTHLAEKVTRLGAMAEEMSSDGRSGALVAALLSLKEALEKGGALLEAGDAYGASEFYLESMKVVAAEAQALIGQMVDSETAAFDLLYAQGEQSYGRNMIIALGCVLLALVVSMSFIVVTLRRITRPLAETISIARKLTEGDYSQRIRPMQNDEFGQLGAIFNEMAEAVQGHSLEARKNIEGLQKVLESIAGIVGGLDAGARQISGSSQSLSQGATEQAASLEQISSSMTEVGSQAKANAENAQQANQLVSVFQEASNDGSQHMRGMMTAMEEIEGASKQILKINKVIDEIAFQTNLLALNAAVEAARAGVHGKGFAVVAEEVRNLAHRSATAAGETNALIEGTVNKVSRGTDIASKTARALEKIVSGVDSANNLVAEIAAASSEQAVGIGQVVQSLGQIDIVTQQNTASAEETAAAAEEISAMTERLREILDAFDGDQPRGRRQQAPEPRFRIAEG